MVENFNLYSSIGVKNFNELYKENSNYLCYTKENENFLIQRFLFDSFFYLKNDYDLNEFEFVKISGKIMNICEENCCFDFYCSICKSSNNFVHSDYQHNIESSQLNFDSSSK